jgi:signal peptidase I
MTQLGVTGDRRRFFNLRFLWIERRRSNRLAFVLFWSIIMYFFFKTFVVSVGIVEDISMHPTLPEGGYYLVNKYIYYFTPPDRGDIVVFQGDKDAPKDLVKRVIGLPGETIHIRFGHVYINGRALDEPYALGNTYPDLRPHLIEDGVYFVLGDNRPVSNDSRHFGAVPGKNIEGKIRPNELFPFR